MYQVVESGDLIPLSYSASLGHVAKGESLDLFALHSFSSVKWD